MFATDFKRMFMRGLTALLPTVVTIALFVWAFSWVNEHIASPINRAIISVLPYPEDIPGFFSTFRMNWENDALTYGTKIPELDPETGRQLTLEYKTIIHPEVERGVDSTDPGVRKRARRLRGQAAWHLTFRKYWILNIIGFIIAIILVYIVGYFLSGLLGRTTLRIVETSIQRLPMIRSIYPNVKQVTDFLLGDQRIEFAGVVAVEYPRKGIWSLGLVTGPGMRTIAAMDNAQDWLTIFIPSSPTPVTGYTITVRRPETIELALSIDEALRFTISGGVIKPPREGGKPEMAMQDVFPGLRRLAAADDADAEQSESQTTDKP